MLKKIKHVEYSALSFSYIFVPEAAPLLEMTHIKVSATIHIYIVIGSNAVSSNYYTLNSH